MSANTAQEQGTRELSSEWRVWATLVLAWCRKFGACFLVFGTWLRSCITHACQWLLGAVYAILFPSVQHCNVHCCRFIAHRRYKPIRFGSGTCRTEIILVARTRVRFWHFWIGMLPGFCCRVRQLCSQCWFGTGPVTHTHMIAPSAAMKFISSMVCIMPSPQSPLPLF